ncbi:MAG TPA: sulfurtransferase [Candidatus Dormibacteraeota bacterium]|nr:sulfurtransferase [Candidatus Dormibacteraeota bacterium]
MKFGPLVSPHWLHEHAHEPDIRIIDFRWYLIGRQGRDAYLAGHIPGAEFVDLDAVTGTGPGRHPLPTRQQFQDAMRRAGVSATSRVVVYDDAGGSIAARLWFLLGWFGHGAQAVLDSGLQGWGEPLETTVPMVEPGDFKARPPKRSRIVDFDQVKRLATSGQDRGRRVLLDARVGERYRGEQEPIDPKKGHIPGAISAPWIENLDADARFKSTEELKKRFEALGVDGKNGVVVYCGSGVNACHDLLALEIAGVSDVRLYAGSWSDYSHQDAPVATGNEPG